MIQAQTWPHISQCGKKKYGGNESRDNFQNYTP